MLAVIGQCKSLRLLVSVLQEEHCCLFQLTEYDLVVGIRGIGCLVDILVGLRMEQTGLCGGASREWLH